MTLKDVSTIVEILQTGSLEGVKFPFVYSYEGTDGEKGLFAVFTELANIDIHYSPYVTHAVCLFREGKLTHAGSDFLEENRKK